MVDKFHTLMMYFKIMPSLGIAILCLALVMFCGIICILIIPIIFNYFIIPNIERKVGERLEFRDYWDYFLFGNFMYRHIEIISYLAIKYLAFKFKGNQDAFKINPKFSLSKINYRIEDASRFEIVMSFVAIINVIVATICLAIAYLISVYN